MQDLTVRQFYLCEYKYALLNLHSSVAFQLRCADTPTRLAKHELDRILPHDDSNTSERCSAYVTFLFNRVGGDTISLCRAEARVLLQLWSTMRAVEPDFGNFGKDLIASIYTFTDRL